MSASPTCEGCPWERLGKIGRAVELKQELDGIVAELLSEKPSSAERSFRLDGPQLAVVSPISRVPKGSAS